MPLAKHNSTTERITGLISSLLNIALSQDLPFRQPQKLQYTWHTTCVLLCVLHYCIGVDFLWVIHGFGIKIIWFTNFIVAADAILLCS